MRFFFLLSPGTKRDTSLKIHYERISFNLIVAELCKKMNCTRRILWKSIGLLYFKLGGCNWMTTFSKITERTPVNSRFQRIYSLSLGEPGDTKGFNRYKFNDEDRVILMMPSAVCKVWDKKNNSSKHNTYEHANTTTHVDYISSSLLFSILIRYSSLIWIFSRKQ